MRTKGVKKEQTRQKVLEAAGRGFRKHGYAGIGVDGLAKAAGVTSGAFYAHFGSKDGAFEQVVAAGLDEVIEGVPRFQTDHGAQWVHAFAQYYLGKPHRQDVECGCAMSALTSEVTRSGPALKTLFEKKMSTIADLAARGLAGGSQEQRRARAWAMLAVLIGGLNLARAMHGTKAAQEISAAIISAAIKAAGRTRAPAKGQV